MEPIIPAMESELISRAHDILKKTADVRLSEKEIGARIEREVAHGFDTQRWVLILNPSASDELLVAALLHDVERIVNLELDKGFSGDRGSVEYQIYKKNHALRSAAFVNEELISMGIPVPQVLKISLLISHHDDNGSEVEEHNDSDLNVLVAADSFSFFTSVAPDMLAREGETRLQDKIYFMIEKMTPSLRNILWQQDFRDQKHGLDSSAAEVIEKIKEEVLSSFH